MPKSVQRTISSVLRRLCTCAGNEHCTHPSVKRQYRPLNPPNKEGRPIIEKAEMLDPEDRSWV
ncbi:hypothetical protein Clacol_007366 [Clathrus columnatus]|uniref:Uncharacterized protein n=1 Tax=Clathrus columnatus TaxID=1419009 RepID=A0AAV5AKZ7_9AGAM|nr:hypothetical protein Clacol_007366 [Clathrus columnatus]